MSKRTWIVTGGCGFIGSQFIRQQLECDQDLSIYNIDALTYAGNRESLADLESHPRYQFKRRRIGDRNEMIRCLENVRPQAVVNLAAETHVDRSINEPMIFTATNVLETQELMEVCRKWWKREERSDFRFLQVSTDEVFGSLGAEDEPFTEKTAFSPNSPYSASKAAGDHLARAYSRTYGFPVIVTNCSNNYGPGQYPEKLIPLVISRALNEEFLPIYGDGTNRRDWLHVNDHAAALRAVLDQGTIGESYCIGGGEELSNLEIVKCLCAHLDRLQPRSSGSYLDLIRFVKDRPGHDFRYAIDHTKITSELGWRPQRRFSEGLEETVEWYLAHPERREGK